MQATTLSRWTSRPAQRGWSTSMIPPRCGAGEGGERMSGGVGLAQDVFALGLPHVALRISLRAASNVMIASARSRVEAKLFSVLNSVRSLRKRSNKFVQDDEGG